MGSNSPTKPSCEFGIDGRWLDIKFSGRYRQDDSGWKLSAQAQEFPSFTETLQKLGLPVLPLLPDFRVKKLGAVFSDDKTVEIGTSMDLVWNPELGGDADQVIFEFNRIEFYCKCRYASQKITVLKCHIQVRGRFCIPHAVNIDPLAFRFDYHDGNWQIDAEVSAREMPVRIFDCTLPSQHVRYAHAPEKDSLTLSLIFDVSGAPDGLKLIDGGDVFHLAVDDFAIGITRENRTNVGLASDHSWEVQICSRAHLHIANMRRFSGTLALSQSAIWFASPDELELTVVKTADLDLGATTRLNKVAIAWGESDSRIEAALDLTLKKEGMPALLKGALPDRIDAVGFAIGKGKEAPFVKFFVDDIQYPDSRPFRIPEIAGIDMGHFEMARLELQGFGVTVGESFGTWIKLGIGLPANMNDIFGTVRGPDDGSEPVLRLFRTLPDFIHLRFELSFSSKSDQGSGVPEVALVLQEPPLLPDWIKCAPGDPATSAAGGEICREWRIVLGADGKYGQIKIDSPKLAFKNGSFASGAKIEVEKELRIPLAPLQWFAGLLTGRTPEEMAAILPESAPIVFPSLLDDDGKIAGHELLELLRAHIGESEMLDAVDDVLNVLDDMADRLPRNLLPYLEPQHANGFKGEKLEYELAINVEEASGSLSLKVDPPARFLSFGGTRLVGCTFRSLSFGPVLGGSLFKLKLDCTFDQFDLAGLAFDLCIPRDLEPPFMARDFCNRLVLDHLMFLIEFETGVPIPIPVYFERLKVDYLDLLGFAARAHAYYDKPALSLGGLIDIFVEMLAFIKDDTHHLDLSEKAMALFPAFYLSNWHIQLPEWIGKDLVLGHKVKDIENLAEAEQEQIEKQAAFFDIQAAKIMQDTLNRIKFFSLNDLITRIPEKYRMGDVDLSSKPLFGLTLGAEAKWVVTTPGHFLQHAEQYDRIVADVDRAHELVTIFPGEIAADTRGAICFLRAAVGIGAAEGSVGGLCLMLGLVSLDGHKLDSAFMLSGQAGPLAVAIKGRFLNDRDQKKLLARVESHVVIGDGWPLFTGESEVEIDSNAFAISGKAEILPGCDFVKLAHHLDAGHVTDEKGLVITAAAELSVIGLMLVGGSFQADQTGARLTGRFLVDTVTLDLSVTQDGFKYTLQRDIPVLYAQTLEIAYSKSSDKLECLIEYTFLSILKYTIRYSHDKKIALGGSFTLSQLGIPLIRGESTIGKEGYTLSGGFNLFPPGAPINYSVAMKGSLSAKGLILIGSHKQGLLGIVLGTTVTIDTHKGIGIQTHISVGRWKVTQTQGHVGVISGAVGFWVSYYLWPFTWYFMVSTKGIYGPLPIRPRNWPVKALQTEVAHAPETRPKIEAPIEAMPILAFLKAVYVKHERSLVAGEDYERFGPVMALYEMEMVSVKDETEGNRSKHPLVVTIDARRPDPAVCQSRRNVFTEVEKGTLDLLIQDKAFRGSPEAQAKAADWLGQFNQVSFTGRNGCGVAHAVWQAEENGQARVESDLRQFDEQELKAVCQSFKEQYLASIG